MAKNSNFIQSICSIENNAILLDGEIFYAFESQDFAEFSKKAYQHLGINYPKYFKMDQLSKLAFLAAELVIKNETAKSNIALLFANKSSSLDTDVKYQKSIADRENYFPSPAVFVYTLPNICIGEISIRHQLNSENSFFIFDAFNAEFMANYANILIDTGKADKVLCGWTEFFNEDYKAFVYLVTKNEGQKSHDVKTLNSEYNK